MVAGGGEWWWVVVVVDRGGSFWWVVSVGDGPSLSKYFEWTPLETLSRKIQKFRFRAKKI